MKRRVWPIELLKNTNNLIVTRSDCEVPFFNCYREMIIQKKKLTTEVFRKVYYGVEEEGYSLCKLMNYHNIDMKEWESRGTMKNYYTTQKYPEKFLKEPMKIKDINLKNINYKFVTGFEYYLKTYNL